MEIEPTESRDRLGQIIIGGLYITLVAIGLVMFCGLIFSFTEVLSDQLERIFIIALGSLASIGALTAWIGVLSIKMPPR